MENTKCNSNKESNAKNDRKNHYGNTIGGVSFLPFIKTKDLMIGVKYMLKKMEHVNGKFGRRIRVSTKNFRYDLPQRFTSELKDYDFECFTLKNVCFVYGGKEKCGKFMAIKMTLHGLPNVQEMFRLKTLRTRTSGTIVQDASNVECRICMEVADGIYLIAHCGHSGYCEKCVNRINKCPVCRGQITRKIKIFL